MSKRRLIDLAQVKRLAALGMTAKQVSEETGFQYYSIKTFLSRNGIALSCRRIDLDEIRRLALLGRTRRQIAATTGFSYSWICRITREQNITIAIDWMRVGLQKGGDVSPFWKQNDALLKACVEAGDTSKEAAAKLGCSKNACVSRAYRLGLLWKRSPYANLPAPAARIEIPPTGNCMYPTDDGYCGKACETRAKSYCAHHHSIVYRPTAPIDMRAAA